MQRRLSYPHPVLPAHHVRRRQCRYIEQLEPRASQPHTAEERDAAYAPQACRHTRSPGRADAKQIALAKAQSATLVYWLRRPRQFRRIRGAQGLPESLQILAFRQTIGRDKFQENALVAP